MDACKRRSNIVFGIAAWPGLGVGNRPWPSSKDEPLGEIFMDNSVKPFPSGK